MKKVIAFVSVFSNAFNIHNDPDRYYYGNEGKYVEGKQTNEAPLKYLLRKHHDIDEVICIVSPEVLVTPEWDPELNKNITKECFNLKYKGRSPYGYLEEQIKDFLKKPEEGFSADKSVTFTPIELSKPTYECFENEVIPEIKKIVHPGDFILLETSGGPRINVIQMMFLARMLLYQKTELKGAVYSEYNWGKKNRLYDVTKYFYDFDLVSGLNEFVSTGATELLDSYFEKSPSSSDAVEELLSAMNDLNKTIILGRISKIQSKREIVEEKLESAQKELEAQKDSPILRILLDQFREKYKSLSTTPELIKWCANNNLIQAAFTLYVEWVPHYILEEAKIITYTFTLTDIDKEKIIDKKTNPSAYILTGFFLCQAYWEKSTSDGYVKVLKNIHQLIKQSKKGKGKYRYKPTIAPEKIKKMLEDYAYAKTLRNEINHASSNEAGGRTSAEEDEKVKDRKEYLEKEGYLFDDDSLDINTLKTFLVSSMDQLIDLAKR